MPTVGYWRTVQWNDPGVGCWDASMYGLQNEPSLRLLLAVLCSKRAKGVFIVFSCINKIFIYKCRQSLCLPDHGHHRISYEHHRRNHRPGAYLVSWNHRPGACCEIKKIFAATIKKMDYDILLQKRFPGPIGSILFSSKRRSRLHPIHSLRPWKHSYLLPQLFSVLRLPSLWPPLQQMPSLSQIAQKPAGSNRSCTLAANVSLKLRQSAIVSTTQPLRSTAEERRSANKHFYLLTLRFIPFILNLSTKGEIQWPDKRT